MLIGLSLKQTQKLTLTPQLQQALKILQLPTQELIQEISTQLQENPFLTAEESSSEEQEAEREDKGELLWESGFRTEVEEEDWDWEEAPQSLTSYLLEQLSCLKISLEESLRVQWIIGALDSRGLLTESIEEIKDSFPAENNFSLEDWKSSLHLLQTFDPAGIGARDCLEALSLQINTLLLRKEIEKNTADLALRIIESHLEQIARRQLEKLKKTLDCNEQELEEALYVISHLDPRPTSRFSNPEINFVLPEIKVEKVKGKWKPKLIRNAPKISLNRMYADAFSSTQTERDTKIWQGRLEEARQFIKSVEQRQTTLLNVSELIVNRQRDFFETGPEKLKPLVLREIADELGIHESTVSRITTGKYLICSRGTFELKYFFSSSHFAAGKSDEEVSASAIKAELKKIILGENPAKPLSDAKLSQLLEQKGFTVARRTVAKYREALGLPPASLRKRC